MNRTIEALMVCTGLLAAACMATEGPEAPEVEPVAAATNLICGAHTVASARTPGGNRMVFCVHDDVEVIAEGGTAERMPIERGACGLDVFLALTDATTPVPARLFDACAKRSAVTPVIGRTLVDGPVFTAFPDDDVALFGSSSFAVDYCGTGGAGTFETEQCAAFEYDCAGPDCAHWCKTYPERTSLHTSWSMLGEQVNDARSVLSSCNGTTRFRGLRDRGAVDATYTTIYDVDVRGGTSWYLTMYYITNGEDAHFQFRGDSYGSATHLRTGLFLDRK